jgi:hypothetical protein
MPVRGTDQVESAAVWLLALLAIVAGVVAVFVGLRTAAAGDARMQAETRTVTRIDATVLDPVPYVTGDVSAAAGQLVPLGWTGADGRPRTTQQWVLGTAEVGSKRPVWVDQAGDPVPRPPDRADVRFGAVLAGVGVFLGSVMVLVCVRLLVRQWAARRNEAAWARGWAAVEPRWSGRAP